MQRLVAAEHAIKSTPLHCFLDLTWFAASNVVFAIFCINQDVLKRGTLAAAVFIDPREIMQSRDSDNARRTLIMAAGWIFA